MPLWLGAEGSCPGRWCKSGGGKHVSVNLVIMKTRLSPMVIAGTHDDRMPHVGAKSVGGRSFTTSRAMWANRVLGMGTSANWKAGGVRSGSTPDLRRGCQEGLLLEVKQTKTMRKRTCRLECRLLGEDQS
jgi:hypothetical protein